MKTQKQGETLTEDGSVSSGSAWCHVLLSLDELNYLVKLFGAGLVNLRVTLVAPVECWHIC